MGRSPMGLLDHSRLLRAADKSPHQQVGKLSPELFLRKTAVRLEPARYPMKGADEREYDHRGIDRLEAAIFNAAPEKLLKAFLKGVAAGNYHRPVFRMEHIYLAENSEKPVFARDAANITFDERLDDVGGRAPGLDCVVKGALAEIHRGLVSFKENFLFRLHVRVEGWLRHVESPRHVVQRSIMVSPFGKGTGSLANHCLTLPTKQIRLAKFSLFSNEAC